MTGPRNDMNVVAPETHAMLAGISAGRPEVIQEALELREVPCGACGLDERAAALVRIASLIALDAPPSSYAFQVASAVEAGVGPDDLVGVLRAVAPQVGMPRVIAAAPEIMLALGLPLSDDAD